MSTPPLPTGDALTRRSRALATVSLRQMFADDPARTDKLAWRFDDWYVDCSKERIDPEALALLVEHAQACDLQGWITALFAGERINVTEGRPALHTALRTSDDTPLPVDGVDIVPQIRAAQERMRAIDAQMRSGKRRGA